MEHARDFIFQAESRVKDITGLSLKALIKSDKVAAINALIDTIKRGDTSDRKAAYFALGQIGEDVTLQILDQVRQRETAAGLLVRFPGRTKQYLRHQLRRVSRTQNAE